MLKERLHEVLFVIASSIHFHPGVHHLELIERMRRIIIIALVGRLTIIGLTVLPEHLPVLVVCPGHGIGPPIKRINKVVFLKSVEEATIVLISFLLQESVLLLGPQPVLFHPIMLFFDPPPVVHFVFNCGVGHAPRFHDFESQCSLINVGLGLINHLVSHAQLYGIHARHRRPSQNQEGAEVARQSLGIVSRSSVRCEPKRALVECNARIVANGRVPRGRQQVKA